MNGIESEDIERDGNHVQKDSADPSTDWAEIAVDEGSKKADETPVTKEITEFFEEIEQKYRHNPKN